MIVPFWLLYFFGYLMVLTACMWGTHKTLKYAMCSVLVALLWPITVLFVLIALLLPTGDPDDDTES